MEKVKIYSSIKEVESDFNYANHYVERAKDSALGYLKAVLNAVHVATVELSSAPIVLTIVEDKVVYFYKIGDYISATTLIADELLKLCKQVHEQHLVKEWKEDEDEQN